MRARVAQVLVTAVTVLLLAGGSCKSGKSGGPDPTVPTKPAPATTTTTVPADPYAIPNVIDEAYVNRVLAALDQIDGDVLRRVVATGGIDPEVLKMLRAIYNDPQYEIELQSLRDLLGRGFGNFKSPPGNRRTLVDRLVTAGQGCILIEAETEFSQVLKNEPPDLPEEIELFTLRSIQQGAKERGLNPTPWSIVNAEVIKRGATPKQRATCDE
ncbi:MAG TPA: hypothetical protein VMZ51_00655 [Acidimicrobiales bacterium]|nr:hypothetical protein [Acidimicrobiales bacterium]